MPRASDRIDMHCLKKLITFSFTPGFSPMSTRAEIPATVFNGFGTAFLLNDI